MLNAIEKLLRATIGVDAGTLGGSALHYALKQRMAACGIDEPDAYLKLLAGSRQELQELINAVIIPETWFFRDREAFAAMARHARSIHRQGTPIRLLSLPCSSGEEPYSMAMAMFDAGFAGTDFVVDAIDVSTRNIGAAELAVYGRNSFRGADLGFRSRYFEAVQGGYRPLPAVLKQVRFRVGNLFDPATIPAADSCEIIFCRNLLIYFDRELQDRALGQLRRILAPNGLLLVGPAESSLPPLNGFVSARLPMAFAFAKETAAGQPEAAAPARSPVTAARPRRQPPPPAKPPAPAPTRRAPVSPPAAAPAPAPAGDAAQQSLDRIERAANAGRLGEARQAARDHIASYGPSPGAFYLLGLACDADGALAEAIESYRKALYLAPDHRETLVHLSLLLQRKGDATGAQALRNRLDRLEKRSGSR